MTDLTIGAEAILTKTQEIIPHDTGTLQRSGAVNANAAKSEVYVSFNTPYAVEQHEDTSLNHPDGRSAKYLEKSFNALKPEIDDKIRRGLSSVLGGD